MLAIVTGVISGLVVIFFAWTAKRIFLARRLFLIQPKLFDYSDLVSQKTARTIELTVFNGGSRPEEDVRVQLSPAFNYTILAADRPDMAVGPDGFLRIDRLAPKQDLTVVMTAEGGEFRKEHVVGLASKEVVGKVKEKLQDAQLSPVGSVAVMLLIFVVMPLLGWGAGNFIEKEVIPVFGSQIGDDEREAATAVVSSALRFKQIAGSSFVSYGASKKTADQMLDTVQVEKLTRTGDVVHIEVAISNRTKERLVYSLSSASQMSDGRGRSKDSLNYIEADIVAFPNTDKTVALSDYLPPAARPQTLLLEVRAESDGVYARRTLELQIITN
ncbi:hypothetical protein [Stenotrophomonas sp. VV52]|uniref:hypothetical protein n=1 Tax=Stenotrophomonas sp. VV52 TaxID=2066958 RepID=UPI000C9E0FF5|nr:hypothetical protein [Stenotrophomonas sp. VV52]